MFNCNLSPGRLAARIQGCKMEQRCHALGRRASELKPLATNQLEVNEDKLTTRHSGIVKLMFLESASLEPSGGLWVVSEAVFLVLCKRCVTMVT